jgi:hypothetical protein
VTFVTDFAWPYLLIAAAGFAAAAALGRVADPRVGGWLCLLVGAVFLLTYALTPGRDGFVLFLGLMSALAGAHSLEVARLHERIGRLVDEARRAGGGGGDG